jgi:hypothetical protein
MRLGEFLVQQELVKVEELEKALRAQVLYGGRLGTNLVEMGFLDLDILARSLAKLLGVPAAVQKHFDQVDPSTLALVPAKLAAKHGCIPLGMTRTSFRQLAVAFMNPQELSAVDELGFVTGARITACVAPELRVLFYLEKFYDLPRKNRYLRMESAAPPDHDERRRFVEPMPEITLAVEVQVPLDLPSARVTLPMPPIPLARVPVEQARMPRGKHAHPPAEKDTLREISPVMDVELPMAAGWPSPVPPPPAARQATPPVVPPRPTLSAKAAIAEIARATQRDVVGDLLVDFLRAGFGCGLVLITRQDMALGWKGFAPGVDDSVLESIATPLGSPSFFHAAYERAALFRGAPSSDGAVLQNRLWKLIRAKPPEEVVVVPVVLKNRVVNLVYAHPATGRLEDSRVADLEMVCASVATAFARLIQTAKQK